MLENLREHWPQPEASEIEEFSPAHNLRPGTHGQENADATGFGLRVIRSIQVFSLIYLRQVFSLVYLLNWMVRWARPLLFPRGERPL